MLSYDDMLPWVCSDDYCIVCNHVSSPLFIASFLYRMHYLYVKALSHYHVLPTFTATASSICYQCYFAKLPFSPSSAFRTCSVVGYMGSKDFDSRADWSPISVILRVDWANEQYSSHDLAWVRHVSELSQVDACDIIRSAQRWYLFKNIQSITPCHVPRFKRPPVIGIDIELPTSELLVCETLRIKRT